MTKKGLYTLEGEEILPCQFIICKELNGISLINRGGFSKDGKVQNGVWGAINKKGKIIIPCKYNDIIPYAGSERIEADGGYTKIFTTLTEIIYEANINGKLLNYGKLFLPERKE